MRLGRTLDEYTENGGWSSHHFAALAVNLISELQTMGLQITIGRTVIHISDGKRKLKAYVHHNGRTEEFATITSANGTELLTVHYSEFDMLAGFLKEQYGIQSTS